MPRLEYVSFVHLKYSFFAVPWKEHYRWKRKLLLDRSLLPSHLPPESHVLTIVIFTLWLCQVLGHLLFAVWKNDPVIYLFLLEPFSKPPSRRNGSGGGFESPMVPWSDEHSTHHVCFIPPPTVAAFCCSGHPHRSVLWVSDCFWSHGHGVIW